MKNIVLIVLIIVCFSCKNKNKQQENTFRGTTPEIARKKAAKKSRIGILEPVKWTTEVLKLSDLEYELQIKASIEKGFHLYSQKEVENNIPIQIKFLFEKNDNYTLIGPTYEEKGITKFEPLLKMEVTYFENESTFKQKIKLHKKEKTTITGEIDYVSCNDSSCVPGYADIEVLIK